VIRDNKVLLSVDGTARVSDYQTNRIDDQEYYGQQYSTYPWLFTCNCHLLDLAQPGRQGYPSMRAGGVNSSMGREVSRGTIRRPWSSLTEEGAPTEDFTRA
jgi:hypothetical protein